jgi:hypothetical protein
MVSHESPRQAGNASKTMVLISPSFQHQSTLLNKPYDAFADEAGDDDVSVETVKKTTSQSKCVVCAEP